MTEKAAGKATSLLADALAYAQRGWSIIPVNGQKIPAVKWTLYQTIAPSATILEKWFGAGKYPGLAVVLGAVSGRLACRDFDLADAYRAWAAAHPDLARTLPTVQTGRGFHVYFTAEVPKTILLGDGELRGEKSLCVLPPSPHPNGCAYQWTVLLPEGALPGIDPVVAGLASADPMPQKQTEVDRSNQSNPKAVGERIPRNTAIRDSAAEIEAAVVASLPREPRTRNRRIFLFARMLKAIPPLVELRADAFRDTVRDWHCRAQSVCTTKAFEETWIDFLKAWPKVRVPFDPAFMDKLLVQAKTAPVEGAEYTDARIGLLLALCRELQSVAREQPFFLATRTGARLLDVDAKTISRWLFLLEHDGWLVTHTKGSNRTWQGTRFYFRDPRATDISQKKVVETLDMVNA